MEDEPDSSHAQGIEQLLHEPGVSFEREVEVSGLARATEPRKVRRDAAGALSSETTLDALPATTTTASRPRAAPAAVPSRLPSSGPSSTTTSLPTADRCAATGTQSEFPLPAPDSSPAGITTGPDGAVWFTVLSTKKSAPAIGRIATSGDVTSFALPVEANPIQLVAGPDRALWFTDAGTNSIGRITTAGVITEFPTPTRDSNPSGIAAGADGALWFTEAKIGQNRVGRATTAGTVTELEPPLGYAGVSGVAAGSDGGMWFTEGLHGQMGRFDVRTGKLSQFPLPSTQGDFGGPVINGVVAGHDGAMWFPIPSRSSDLDKNPNALGRMSTTGAVSEFPIGPGTQVWPEGITAGSDGALWFTERAAIGRMTTTGQITELPALSPSFSSYPGGIAAGPDGAVWFTDTGGSKIGRVSCRP